MDGQHQKAAADSHEQHVEISKLSYEVVESNSKGSSSSQSIRIFLVDLKDFNLSRSTLFVCLASAVVVFYSLYAILQEKITRSMTATNSFLGWFLTLSSFIVIVSLSFIERSFVKAPPRLAPLRAYLRIGFLQSMTYFHYFLF